MISAYRTFAATAAFMGVSRHQVDVWVDGELGRGDGPLIARVFPDGRRLIHHDDLLAFRRPLSATSVSGGFSALCQLSSSSAEEVRRVPAALHLATVRVHEVAQAGLGARRGTMATKGYRALADVDEIRRQGERFMRFVSPEPNTGCHLWTGCFDKRHGYGYFRLWPAKVIAAAHRVAWVLAYGLIPERTDIDHAECSNRWCVNPAHLEAVSHAENIRRRDEQRAARGLPDNCAIARAVVAARHLRLVQP